LAVVAIVTIVIRIAGVVGLNGTVGMVGVGIVDSIAIALTDVATVDASITNAIMISITESSSLE